MSLVVCTNPQMCAMITWGAQSDFEDEKKKHQQHDKSNRGTETKHYFNTTKLQS